MGTYPVNQVFLGGDPYSDSSMDIESKIKALQAYEEQLKGIKARASSSGSTIWNSIDNEILSMTEELRNRLFSELEYLKINTLLLILVQAELLNLVKDKVEASELGKSLLNSLLETVKKLKTNIVEESTRELELFKKFREFSKTNPDVTYDEFIKANK